MSHESCSFLDLTLYKGVRFRSSRRLDFSLYVKETALWRPLAPSSLHAPFVHVAWPLAQLHRIRKRFSDLRLAEREAEHFKLKLDVAGCILPQGNSSLVKRPHRLKALSWLVLPYRPEFTRGLAGVISKLNSDFEFLAGFIDGSVKELADINSSTSVCFRPLIGISWTLDAPNILRRLNTSNQIMDMECPEYYGLFTQGA